VAETVKYPEAAASLASRAILAASFAAASAAAPSLLEPAADLDFGIELHAGRACEPRAAR